MKKSQKKQLQKQVALMVEGCIEACGPHWAEPCVFLSSSKAGLFISLTEENEYDVTMPWKKFEESVVQSDINLIAKYLSRFKSIVRKMEQALNNSDS